MAYPYTKKFTPKRPVHTFRDLEVYQKTMEASVIIIKSLKPKLKLLKYDFVDNLVNCAMSIPLRLGEGHSLRFGDHARAILLLEHAMAECNKAAIYLEQVKGIYGSKLDRPSADIEPQRVERLSRKSPGTIDPDLIDDLVRRYADTRGKIFRLEKSWQKFHPPEK